MAALQLLCCKDKEMTKTEAMHQHVNIMTKKKLSIYIIKHTWCVNE
jgi:hypothetical protein